MQPKFQMKTHSDFFEVFGYKSIIFVAMSCELCSTLHKILSGLSGAKDGLDMKDFHAMTNSDEKKPFLFRKTMQSI